MLPDAKVPNASSFASQWNIGFKVHTQIIKLADSIAELGDCSTKSIILGQLPVFVGEFIWLTKILQWQNGQVVMNLY